MLLAKQPELLKKSDEKRVNEIWLDLLDFYYRSTNKAEWIKFLNNLKRVARLKKEITGCKSAFELIGLMDESGYDYLKSFGIDSTDKERIRSSILAKETNLEFAELKMIQNDKKEAFNMYRILAGLKISHNISMDVENTCLAEWVEILRGISEKNKAETEAYNKTKVKSRR